MATRKKHADEEHAKAEQMTTANVPPRPGEVPPGATRAAWDREYNPEGGPPGSGGGGRDAAGTPGGGSEVGGLGGTNIGDGDPSNADLEEAMFGNDPDNVSAPDEGVPYSGIAGGAVGGSPAEGRAAGGNIHGGLAPGGTHRGDSTIGSNPDPQSRSDRAREAMKEEKKC